MLARHESRGTNLAPQSGIEQGPVCKHDASNLEQAIRHAAKRPRMAVTASTQCGVLGLADGVVLDGDAVPVVDRVPKPVVGRQAAHYNDRLAGSAW